MNEPALQEEFALNFGSDFDIRRQVVGQSMIEQKSVVVDFLMRPKQHLVDRGFDDGWIGVEVKHLKSYRLSEVNALGWQCLSYAQSCFTVESHPVRPCFVLMYTNISLNLQAANKNGMPAETSGVISFLERGNVGWIERDSTYTWRIGFGSHGYFNLKYGRAAIPGLGVKRHAGNVSC